MKEKIFWLHVKKSGGKSTRKILKPVYREVDRSKWPINFMQADRDQYNDILNNYRILLGEYQFRRCLFARKYLYGDDWERRLKFAFSREPVSRCLSQFFYLHFSKRPSFRWRALRSGLRIFRNQGATSYQFDRFLDRIEHARAASSSIKPDGIFFRTHTAAMWDDVTDEKGAVMLDRIYRLDDFADGIAHVFDLIGQPAPRREEMPHLNRTGQTGFAPDRRQLQRIETLFAQDFEIYEGHCHRFT